MFHNHCAYIVASSINIHWRPQPLQLSKASRHVDLGDVSSNGCGGFGSGLAIRPNDLLRVYDLCFLLLCLAASSTHGNILAELSGGKTRFKL